MKIVTVIPLTKGIFREDLTYFTAQEIAPGSVVSVFIRNRKILALATSVEELSATKTNIKELDFSLKKISEVKDKSIFEEKYLEASFALAKYFNAKKNTAVASLLPNIFIENYDKVSRLIEENNSNLKNREKEERRIKSEKLILQTNLEDRISYYKTLIRGSFAQKKSVFMVLPTENDILNFQEKLSKGIENYTIVIYGNQSSKKQLEACEEILSTTHPILILGTAPYLSIPRKDIETIILEHESSNAYKMVPSPHFDLRTFVEIYATLARIKLIFGDTLMRYETIARIELDGLSEVRSLSYRLNYEGTVEIIDRNILGTNNKFSIFDNITIEEIKHRINRKENVFIFSLRKGLATMTVCRDCGTSIMCDNCHAPVVLYLSKDSQKRMFVCNKCGTPKSPETLCTNCGSWNLMPLGIGTDTICEELKSIFPKNIVKQLDKEIAGTAKGAEKIIKEFDAEKGAILVGTEMAVLYLKEKVPTTIIASFDSLWSIPNFRMGEKIIQLLISIMQKTGKKLLIQTKNTEDESIKAILNENLLNFVREELKDRENLEYPPYKRFIKITYLGNKSDTARAKEILAQIFEEYKPIIFSGFISKQKDKYVTNALIKLNPKNWSLPELSVNSNIDEKLAQKLKFLAPDYLVNIDPEDLL